jgi:hypothetical protein
VVVGASKNAAEMEIKLIYCRSALKREEKKRENKIFYK